jgi:hypothetical protein
MNVLVCVVAPDGWFDYSWISPPMLINGGGGAAAAAFISPFKVVECLFYRLRSSLWLQFKPHHIAAGAVYLAAKFLNLNLAFYQNIWQEFQTTPAIIQGITFSIIIFRNVLEVSVLKSALLSLRLIS